MRIFTVMIRMNTRAFKGILPGGRGEVARVLRETERRVLEGEDSGQLEDSNGNHVGEFWHEPPKE